MTLADLLWIFGMAVGLAILCAVMVELIHRPRAPRGDGFTVRRD